MTNKPDFGRLKEYFPLFGTPFYANPLNTSSSLDSAQVTKYLKKLVSFWFVTINLNYVNHIIRH